MSLSETELEAYTSSHLNLKDNTLDENELVEHCPLDIGRHTLKPKCNLGSLDLLPSELLSGVLSQLDLQSLTDFRRVNQRAMGLVNSVPHYEVIINHAPAALRGMLSIGTAKLTTCQDLYDKLCTANCDTCGDFGGYLYLITSRRVCFICLSGDVSYLPLLRVDVVRKFGLESRDLATIPQIRSIPGYYSPNKKICRKRLTLFDHDSARCAGIAVHGTVSAMEEYVSKVAEQRRSNFKDKESMYLSTGGQRGKPRPLRDQDAWDAKSGNPYRFMAIVSAPFFNAKTRSIAWGLYCIGCRDEKEGPDMHWRKRFTMETFIDHMKQWGEIIDRFHRRSLNSRKMILH
ncbi:MAG: hypothetical protein Q9163_005254 [Psora crenata]